MEHEQKQHQSRSIIRDFCLNTSTHGLGGIARSGNIYNRLFWSISFIIYMGIMIYFIVKALLDYFEYPTNIDVSYISEIPQNFAAFSLCNGSPMRLDRFIGPFLNYTNATSSTDWNDTNSPIYAFPSVASFFIDQYNKNETFEQYFYTLPTILYSCHFNRVPCSTTDFISFLSSEYGFCYTFNAKLKNTTDNKVRLVNQYGGIGELSLGLYIHSHQYVPNIRNGEYTVVFREMQLFFLIKVLVS